MRAYLVTALLILSPTCALAQNWAIVEQYGKDNRQTTVQSGRNFSLSLQKGSNNEASTVQNGNRNASAIVQLGSGHERSHVQNTNGNAMGSLQVNSKNFSGSTTIGDSSRLSLYFEAAPTD